MSKFIQHLSLIIVVLLCTQCAEDEVVTDRPYPRLRTLEVTEISREGAVFNARFLNRGNFEILSYGFIWSQGGITSSSFNANERVIITKDINEDGFSAKITTTLLDNFTYGVRAFVITSEFTVFGNILSFESQGGGNPSLLSVTPDSGTPGDTVLVRGRDFSYLSLSQLSFGGNRSVIIEASDTTLLAIVPETNSSAANVKVSVYGAQSASIPFQFNLPTIASVSPTQVRIDDTLTITGTNFSWIPSLNTLSIGSQEAKVTASSRNRILAVVPTGLDRSNPVTTISVNGQSNDFNETIRFLPPQFDGYSPVASAFGDSLFIQGRNLSISRSRYQVFFGDAQASVLSARRNELVVIVPDDIQNTSVNITVDLEGESFDLGAMSIAPPIISSVTPAIVRSADLDTLIIKGDNFSLFTNRKVVTIGNVEARILRAFHDELILAFPEELIPDENRALFRRFNVAVETIGQKTVLNRGLTIDYIPD